MKYLLDTKGPFNMGLFLSLEDTSVSKLCSNGQNLWCIEHIICPVYSGTWRWQMSRCHPERVELLFDRGTPETVWSLRNGPEVILSDEILERAQDAISERMGNVVLADWQKAVAFTVGILDNTYVMIFQQQPPSYEEINPFGEVDKQSIDELMSKDYLELDDDNGQ